MFELDEQQKKKLAEWVEKQNQFAIEKQKESISESDPSYSTAQEYWKSGYPYTGAIGGGLTYCFSPTGLGIVTKVQYSLTDEEIDLTDYDEW